MDITAQEFLQSFFNPDEEVCLRIYDDKKNGVFSGQKLSIECGKFTSIEETLRQHNAQGRGISFVVNYGGQKDSEITRINAQFVESDDLSLEEQQKQLDDFKYPPSLIIKTRKSLHAYWLVRDAKVEMFRTVQKQLVKQFQGDPTCVNESKVMRLPGFNHCKEDPIKVKCILFHPERIYTQDELSEALPVVDDQPVEKKTGSERGLALITRECDFIRYCKDNAASLPEPLWYAMMTELALLEGGVEMIHEYSKPYKDYNPVSTQKKINHFLDSGTRPMTCKAIAEKGFKCPKMLNGKCTCKAPAAMIYMPMSPDALKIIIGNLPVTGDSVTDMQTADHFVEEYLFNQDNTIAETLINAEMRTHFSFTSASMKLLISKYKEVSKAFKKSSKAKTSTKENGLPPWYEFTDRGIRFMPGLLANHMAKTEHMIYATHQRYMYSGGVYLPIDEEVSQKAVRKEMLPRETKMSQISDVESQWRLLVHKDVKELNSNAFIINLKNGLYNVLEDQLTEHTHDYYSTIQIHANYNPGADCPLFKAFLKDSMEGDMEQVKLIQEMMGYCLIPVNSAQKCFILVGIAAAGKSVLLRVISEILLGKENVSNVSWQELNDRFKTAELFGKLANVFADLPTKNIDDNGIFKALVGEDYLNAERKYGQPFNFQSTARLLFSCNSIPKNYGDRSDGFFRRLIIIRFNHAVPENLRDPNLIQKFRDETDGILLFALEGLHRLMENGFKFSETETNRKEVQQYREDSDSVLSFVKEDCVLDGKFEIGSTELYNAYKAYCEKCGLKSFSQKQFVSQIITANPSVKRSVDKLGKRRTLAGIKLGDILD